MSLDRLGLDHAPVYIMHRDNPEVPVAEFVDVLDDLHSRGLIGAIGGSNWSVARFAEARAYAQASGRRGLSLLNNNLSLAVMERPVWAGCITSNQPEALAFLRAGGVTHLSWSSQARAISWGRGAHGAARRHRPRHLLASADNEERRRQAEALAADYGVHPHNIATAWVLGQGFPSLALIGPRTIEEIRTTLPALGLRLSAARLRGSISSRTRASRRQRWREAVR